MAIGDLFHLQLIQNEYLKSEKLITNWFFAAVDILGNSQGLFEGFTKDNGMLELINAVQAANINNQSIKIVNLFSLTDFYEEAIEGTGAVASEMLPPFCGVSFTKKLDTRGVRPGRVNIPGVPEGWQVAGVISDTPGITALNALKNAMDNDVVEPLGAVFDPVVIKRIPYVLDAGEPTERTAYRLPANAGEANYGHVVSALVNLRVAHINTRGNGR